MAITEYYVSTAGGGTHDGSSEANALTLSEMVTQINALGVGGAAGRKYNIKGNHTARGAADVLTVQGTATSPLILSGYVSAINDLDNGTLDQYGALDISSLPQITYSAGDFRFSYTTGSNLVVKNLRFSNNYNGTGTNFAVGGLAVENCYFENTNTGSSAHSLDLNAANASIVNVLIAPTSGATGAAINLAASANMIGVRVVGYGGNGIRSNTAGNILDITNCTISVGLVGILCVHASAVVRAVNTTIYGCTDGIDIASASTAAHKIVGCHITDCAGVGIDFNGGTSGGIATVAGNRYRDNGTDVSGYADWVTATAVRNITTDAGGASTDYVDAATNKDFRLISTAAGYRQGFAYKANIGACGDNVTAGSGSPLLTGCPLVR